MREIKFRLIFRGKIFGIEKLTKTGWQWMAYDLNPDKGERWSNGVFPADDKYTRDMFTGLKDKNGVDIYEGDTVDCWDNAADEENGYGKHHIGVIEYTPDCYSLRIKGAQIYNTPAVKQWENDVFLTDWSNAENILVIGNIHQQP